ncbi:MAG: hypothetical protein QXG33_01765 [Candidatus Anstonellales archaeon]
MEITTNLSNADPSFSKDICSNLPFPIKVSYPLFEPRAPYTSSSNYFQPMYVDGQKQPIRFAGDSTRALSIYEGNLILLSKFVETKEGKEHFQSYFLIKFSPSEFNITKTQTSLTISANCKKILKNIITKEEEERTVSFAFVHKDISHAIINKKGGLSTKVKEVYEKKVYPLLNDLENYLISVPHFNPHPYLLDCYSELGFKSRREMQIKSWEYLLK